MLIADHNDCSDFYKTRPQKKKENSMGFKIELSRLKYLSLNSSNINEVIFL